MSNDESVKISKFISTPVKSARLIFAVFIAAAVGMPGLAQQVEPEPASTVESDPTQDTPAESTSTKSTNARTEPAIRFNPSEKIGADDAVSFPVDI